MSNSSTPSAPRSHTPTPSFWLAGILIALTVARWLVPTEATAEGETLWIAVLWFAAGVAVPLLLRTQASPRRFDLADPAVMLFLGGHVVSGLIVVFGAGDRRAALNLLWEWLSLGVFWFAWRGALRNFEIRRLIVPVLITTAVTLSIWGLWQYFVWYPQMQAKYGPLFEKLEQLPPAGPEAAAIRRQLGQAGIPAEGAALLLFKNRLLQSHEPFGPFALANTFGGLLAAWLIIGLGAAFLSDASKKRILWRNSLYLLSIAICLYLTNSRTAWGGVFVGLGLAGVIGINSHNRSAIGRRWLFPIVSLGTVVIGLAGMWWLIQNEHAVPGPLKSLSYRVEYWTGTWKLLATSPWLGSGLGQFRDRYLAHRLQQSSEEIADPHNMLLDVWANGSLIGLAGIIGLIALVWMALWRISITEVAAPQSPPMASAGPNRNWIIPGLTAFVLVILAQIFSTGIWDDAMDRLAVFAVVWLGVAWLVPRGFSSDSTTAPAMGLIAATVLSVHLLGAGGIAMPAVTQLWLLLIAWGLTPEQETELSRSGRFPVRYFVMCGLSGLMLIGCFLTGWRPVAERDRHLTAGERHWTATGDRERAEREFRSAADADPLSPQPWQRLAELEFSRAMASSRGIDRQHFDSAIAALNEARLRAPDRPSLALRLAELKSGVASRTRLQADWAAAAEAYRDALPRHPTNVRLLADFTVALSHSGSAQEAAEIARRALAQDQINRSRGHTDRYLPEGTLDELREIEARRRGG